MATMAEIACQGLYKRQRNGLTWSANVPRIEALIARARRRGVCSTLDALELEDGSVLLLRTDWKPQRGRMVVEMRKPDHLPVYALEPGRAVERPLTLTELTEDRMRRVRWDVLSTSDSATVDPYSIAIRDVVLTATDRVLAEHPHIVGIAGRLLPVAIDQVRHAKAESSLGWVAPCLILEVIEFFQQRELEQIEAPAAAALRDLQMLLVETQRAHQNEDLRRRALRAEDSEGNLSFEQDVAHYQEQVQAAIAGLREWAGRVGSHEPVWRNELRLAMKSMSRDDRRALVGASGEARDAALNRIALALRVRRPLTEREVQLVVDEAQNEL